MLSLQPMWQFEHSNYLWALLVLIPLAVLLFVLLRWKKNVLKKLGNPQLIQLLTKNHSNKKYQLKIILVLIAIITSIIAISNLRKPDLNNSTASNGIDIMIALDVSKSMLGQDEKPTRLDKAKQFIYQLSNNLHNNNIGLVVFAGEAFLQMPLTNDIAASKIFISNASTDLISVQGTVISDALNLCDASLDTKTKKSKAVILITDGDDHDDKAIEAAKKLAEHGTVLYSIGVGSATGTPIIEAGTNEYKRDKNGATVITKLNETLLTQIAEAANGKFYNLNNTSAIAVELANELNTIEKKPINNNGGNVQFQSFYMYFLGFAILLLLIEFFISEQKKQII